MNVSRTVVTAAALISVAGCGLANQRHGITWTATLDSLPDTSCVRDTISALPGIAQVENHEGKNREVFGITLKGGGPYPDMRVIVMQPPEPLQFQMVYGDYDTLRHERERAARMIVDGLSASCGVSELARRVREDRTAEWSPYLFNI